MNRTTKKILTKVLHWLEAGGDDGKVAFNLNTWNIPAWRFRSEWPCESLNYNTTCGTVACIGGRIAMELPMSFDPDDVGPDTLALTLNLDPVAFRKLTHPTQLLVLGNTYHSWNSVTAAEAAKALARFIETDGAESWEDNE